MEGKLADSSTWSSALLLANTCSSLKSVLYGEEKVCNRSEMK